MSTAAKKTRCHLVAWEVADTAQAKLHRTRVLRIFVDENTEADAKHRQRNVYNAFRITILNLKAMSFFVGERHNGGMAVVQHLHVDVEQVALQSQPRLGSCVETKKTIEELTIEAKEDYKKLAELVFLLSLKTIEHKDDKEFLDLYIAKYAELGQYAFDTLEGEELKYFYQILRLKH